MKIFFNNLITDEIQIDEYWGFVFKKEKNLTEEEKLLEVIGNIWTFTAIMPDSKLIFAHIEGKRTKNNARKLISTIRKRLNATDLYITSDGNEDYVDSISSIYGRLNDYKDEMILPEKFCYGQVIKDVEKGRCIKVTRRVIFGSYELLEEKLTNSKVSFTMNTSYIERSNLTMRQHNHRVERKTQGFSKLLEYHKYQTSLTIAYYNFCLPHRSLEYLCRDKKIRNTPVMKAGLTDHVWTMRELLAYPLVPD